MKDKDFKKVMKKIKECESTFDREKIAMENELVAPKNAILELTQKCPLNCRHCCVLEQEPEELSGEKWIEIIDKLKSIDVKKVIIEGGEPTIHQDFDKILRYAESQFDSVSVQTSGYTIPDLNDHDINLTVSLEYLDPRKNNWLRRVTPHKKYKYYKNKMVSVKKENVKKFEELWKQLQEGEDVKEKLLEMGVAENSYQKAIETLKKNSDLSRNIRTTIYNDNDVLGIAILAERLGVNSVFVPLKPVGFGKELKGKTPSMKRLKELIKMIMTFNEHSRMEHRIEETYWYLSNKKLWERFGDIFRQRMRICEGGIHRLFINYKGEVTPCLMLNDLKMGNIFKKKTKNILQDMYKWSVKSTKLSKEKSCGNCLGGCLAVVYANKELSENPCPLPIYDKKNKRGD